MAKLPNNAALNSLLLGIISVLLASTLGVIVAMWQTQDARMDRVQQRQDRILNQLEGARDREVAFRDEITGWYAILLERMARIEQKVNQ